MKILLSPTKKQEIRKSDYDTTKPLFISSAKELVEKLNSLDTGNYQSVLKISEKLLDINLKRLKEWNSDPEESKSSTALFTFTGEAFSSLDPSSLTGESIQKLNESLLIFSGLYGFLKPLDKIMLYRLDIADKLNIDGYKSLYDYWSDRLTNYLIDEINKDKDKLLINLSSTEYSKSIDFKKVPGKIITPDFKTYKNGKLKTEAIWSKRMRGLLTRKIITENIKSEEELQKIILDGYRLDSTTNGNYLYIKEGE